MATNKEVNASEWVDRRLLQLAPDDRWKPDVARGLACFHARRANRPPRAWIWTTLAFAAACICVLAWPTPREIAGHFFRSFQFKLVDIGQVSADAKALKDGQTAPDFVLKDAAGADIRLSAYKGKVVLLNFWATWCHGCELEIPWLIDFQKKYKDRGFTILGVSLDADGWKAVKPFLEEKKVNYPVVIGHDDMARRYGLDAMPMTFLIDRDGKVAATSVGIVNKTACERQIAELLGSAHR
jgi:peroxiredoxin